MPLITSVEQLAKPGALKGVKTKEPVREKRGKFFPKSPEEKRAYEKHMKKEHEAYLERKREYERWYHIGGEKLLKKDYEVYVDGKKVDELPLDAKNFQLKEKGRRYLRARQGKDKEYGTYSPRVLDFKDGILVKDVNYTSYRDPSTEKNIHYNVGPTLVKEWDDTGMKTETYYKDDYAHRRAYYYGDQYIGGEKLEEIRHYGNPYWEARQYLKKGEPVPPDLQKYAADIVTGGKETRELYAEYTPEQRGAVAFKLQLPGAEKYITAGKISYKPQRKGLLQDIYKRSQIFTEKAQRKEFGKVFIPKETPKPIKMPPQTIREFAQTAWGQMPGATGFEYEYKRAFGEDMRSKMMQLEQERREKAQRATQKVYTGLNMTNANFGQRIDTFQKQPVTQPMINVGGAFATPAVFQKDISKKIF